MASPGRPPKTAAPLGATVQDYVAGRAFLLHRALPLLALALLLTLLPALLPCAAAAPLRPCTPWRPLRLLLLACAALCALLLVLGLCALRAIATWLPSVPQPCYELLHAATGAPLLPPRALPLAQRAAWEVAATADPAARASLVLRARYSDRLGNNLFQYVYARLRAALLDVAFEAPPLGGPFAGVAQRVERWGAAGQQQQQQHAQQLRGDAQGAPPSWRAAWQAWLLEPSCRYSMNTRLLAGFEAQVVGWLRPSLDAAAAAAAPPAWGARDVAIHVRLGDILWGHHAAYRPLPMSFYWAALARVAQRAPGGNSCSSRSSSSSSPCSSSLGRVVLVAEGSSSSSSDRNLALLARMADALRDPAQQQRCAPGGLSIGAVEVRMGGSMAQDLALLYTAPALILSISSFSWWPAFLARPGALHTIVLPQWGLLLPHAWHPNPLSAPDFAVVQCMALAAVPVSQGAVEEEEEEEGGRGGRAGAGARAAAGAGRGGAGSLQRREAALRRALASLGGAEGASYPSSAVVIEVPLPDLPCWGGNTKEAMDALFT